MLGGGAGRWRFVQRLFQQQRFVRVFARCGGGGLRRLCHLGVFAGLGRLEFRIANKNRHHFQRGLLERLRRVYQALSGDDLQRCGVRFGGSFHRAHLCCQKEESATDRGARLANTPRSANRGVKF